MSTSNPWAIYITVVTGALLIYYLIVGWKFYKMEIGSLLHGKVKRRRFESVQRSDQIEAQHYSTENDGELSSIEQPEAPQDEELFTQVESLLEHLTAEIEEASQKDYNKQDLVQMLQMILNEYGALKGTQFQFSINNHIDAECAKYGLLHLSEGDKIELWSRV